MQLFSSSVEFVQCALYILLVHVYTLYTCLPQSRWQKVQTQWQSHWEQHWSEILWTSPHSWPTQSNASNQRATDTHCVHNQGMNWPDSDLRWRAEHFHVLLDAVQGLLSQQVGHECGSTVEEGVQLWQRNLLPLVAMIEDILYLRKPTGGKISLYIYFTK